MIVPELLRAAAPRETWRPSVSHPPDGQVVELAGHRIRSAVHEFVDPDQILGVLASRAIAGAVLSPWVPLLFYDADAQEGLDRCRLQNLGLARLRKQHPEALWLLGAVPLQEPELAAAELVAVMAGGEFAGVEITASVNGRYLGDPVFEPFWTAAEQSGALVFVHPTTRGFAVPVFDEHYLWNLVGNPMETTVAAAHLILSGTLERHPRLRVLLAHGGGAILSVSGRIRHGQESVTAAGPRPAQSADVLLRRFLFDTVTHDPRLLRTLVDIVGPDRVLLGSDYPFDMADPDPVGTVRAAGLQADEERALLGANAMRELGAPTAAGSSADA